MSYNTKPLNPSLFDGADSVFDEKPPAPPVRLASARELNTNNSNVPMDMRPLPKAPEEDKKALKKSKLRSSMKRSNENSNGLKKDHYNQTGSNNLSSGFGGFHYWKDSEKPVISPPTNFEHTLHVGFDPSTGEFTGMPKNWYIMLKNSNISKTEQKKNPQAVIEVLKWYESKDKDKGFKYMTMGEYKFKVMPEFTFGYLQSILFVSFFITPLYAGIFSLSGAV